MMQVKYCAILIMAAFPSEGFVIHHYARNICAARIITKSHRPFPMTKVPRELFDIGQNGILDVGIAKIVFEGLWYFPLLSILSGFSPASRIIAESHVSRLPDTPIAHDIDTFLLWPYSELADGFRPKSIFQAPEAAITDKNLYDVDWDEAREAFTNNFVASLEISLLFAIVLYLYLYIAKNRVFENI